MSYMYIQAEKRNAEIKEFFKDLNANQIWTILKLCRNYGKYCRSGVGGNNFMNACFKDIAKFERVQKVQGEKFYGAKISVGKYDNEFIEN